MKSQKIFLVMALICCFLVMAGCSANSNQQEDYTGTWAEEDVSWISGGMIMDVSRMQDELMIQLFLKKPAPYGGGQSLTVKFPEADIKDGFISVEFEGDDYGGYTGTLELQFNDDRVYCEMKDLVYLDDEVSPMALFYDGTTTLIRMDDAHERMECTDEEYNAWYAENFPAEQTQEEDAAHSSTATTVPTKSGQDIIATMKRTAEFTWNMFYENGYTNKNDTIISSQWTADWIYERVTYPGVSSLQDIRTVTNQYYTPDLVDGLISLKDWIEYNGGLYESATEGLGGFGPDPVRVDMKVTRKSDTCYLLTIYNIYGDDVDKEMFPDETYDIQYMYVNGYWVFDSVFYAVGDKNGNINVI